MPVLGDLGALGANRLVFTGGEPFLCAHWEPLAQLACRDGLSVQFVSNGLMVDRRLADRLRGLPGVSVGFSLDGCRPKTHDRIRGKPGLHVRVLAATKRLIDRGIPAAVVTTVQRSNLAELDGLYELLQGSGIYAWQIQAAVPTGRMAERPGLALDSSGYLALARFIARIAREGKLRVHDLDETLIDAPPLEGIGIAAHNFVDSLREVLNKAIAERQDLVRDLTKRYRPESAFAPPPKAE